MRGGGYAVEVPEYPIEEEVKLPAKETAVIVVDMQNDFVKPGGKLVVPEALGTIPKIRGLLERARQAGALVVYTQDTHYPGDPEFQVYGEHCIRGTWGWEIVDELKPARGDVVIEKPRFNAFHGTMLDDVLRTRGIKNVVLVGTVANICVLATAIGAHHHHYHTVIPLDSVSALNRFGLEILAYQVATVLAGKVTPTAAAIKFT